jgi:hypothetical protein
MSGEFPSRRGSPHGLASTSHVSSAALAAHPTRPLFVSGSSSGHVYMWQYGGSESLAGYVPALGGARGGAKRSVHEAVTAQHWGEPARLMFSRNGYRFGAVGEGGVVALWRSDCMDAVRRALCRPACVPVCLCLCACACAPACACAWRACLGLFWPGWSRGCASLCECQAGGSTPVVRGPGH